MTDTAAPERISSCPECGKQCQDQRGVRGHLRFGHGMSTDEIRQAVAQPADWQQEHAQERPEAVEAVEEVEEVETLPVLHEGAAPAREGELPGDLRELQLLLVEVRRYQREAREMLAERGPFDDDQASRNLVRLWEAREERITRTIVEIGASEGVQEEPGFLDWLFAEEAEEEEDWL